MNARYLRETEMEPILFPVIPFHIHVSHPVINLYRSKLTAQCGEKLLRIGQNERQGQQKGSSVEFTALR